MEHSFVYNAIAGHLGKRDSQPAREFAQWAGDYAQKLRHFEQDARSREKDQIANNLMIIRTLREDLADYERKFPHVITEADSDEKAELAGVFKRIAGDLKVEFSKYESKRTGK